MINTLSLLAVGASALGVHAGSLWQASLNGTTAESSPESPLTPALNSTAGLSGAYFKRFTVKAYHSGFQNPGNLTGWDMVARNGSLILVPPKDCREGSAGSQGCIKSRDKSRSLHRHGNGHPSRSLNETSSGSGSESESEEETIIYTDSRFNTAYLYPGRSRQIYLDPSGTLRYFNSSSARSDQEAEPFGSIRDSDWAEAGESRANQLAASEAIFSPFYRLGRNPRKLVYDNATIPAGSGGSEASNYPIPAPAVFAALPWTGSFFFACVSDNTLIAPNSGSELGAESESESVSESGSGSGSDLKIATMRLADAANTHTKPIRKDPPFNKDSFFNLKIQLAYWFNDEEINAGKCTQVWLSALDYDDDDD